MNFSELLKRRRTVRKFQQRPVPDELLKKIVEAARQASCAANMQRLRYTVIRTPELVQEVLEKSAWAAKVKPRRTPVWGKDAPAAFIAVTATSSGSSLEADAGAALQSMEFAACDLGLGSCWLGAIDRPALSGIVGQEPLYLLALGFPAEEPVCDEIGAEDCCDYFLDDSDRLHVPKICVADLLSWK